MTYPFSFFIRNIFWVILALSLSITTAKAQQQDAVLWLGASAEKKVMKKLDISFEQQVRFKQNMQQFNSSLSEVGLSYKLAKKVKIAGIYRYTVRRKTNSHRLSSHIQYKQRIKPLKLNVSGRIKYQYDFTHLDYEQVLRPKVKLTYSRKKYDFEPFIANEWFYELDNRGNQFERFRITTGCNYHLHKQHDLSLFYTLQQALNVPNPSQEHIFGINYSFNL